MTGTPTLQVTNDAYKNAMEMFGLNINSPDKDDLLLAFFYFLIRKLHLQKKLFTACEEEPEADAKDAWFKALFGTDIRGGNQNLPLKIILDSIKKSGNQPGVFFNITVKLVYSNDQKDVDVIDLSLTQTELNALKDFRLPQLEDSTGVVASHRTEGAGGVQEEAAAVSIESVLSIAPCLRNSLFGATVTFTEPQSLSKVVESKFGEGEGAFQATDRHSFFRFWNKNNNRAAKLISEVNTHCGTNDQVNNTLKTIEIVNKAISDAKGLWFSRARAGAFIDEAKRFRVQLFKSSSDPELVQFCLDIQALAATMGRLTSVIHRGAVEALLKNTKEVLSGEKSYAEFLPELQGAIASCQQVRQFFNPPHLDRVRKYCEDLLEKLQARNRDVIKAVVPDVTEKEVLGKKPLQLLRLTSGGFLNPELLFGKAQAKKIKSNIAVFLRNQELNLSQENIGLYSAQLAMDDTEVKALLDYIGYYPSVFKSLGDGNFQDIKTPLAKIRDLPPMINLPVFKTLLWLITNIPSLDVQGLLNLCQSDLIGYMLDQRSVSFTKRNEDLITALSRAFETKIGNGAFNEDQLKQLEGSAAFHKCKFNVNEVRAKWFVAQFKRAEEPEGFKSLMRHEHLQSTYDAIASDELRRDLAAAINAATSSYLDRLSHVGFIDNYNHLLETRGYSLVNDETSVSRKAVLVIIKNIAQEAAGKEWFALFRRLVANEEGAPETLRICIEKDEDLRRDALQSHFHWIANFGSAQELAEFIGIFSRTFVRANITVEPFIRLDVEGTAISARIDFSEEPFKAICAQAIKRTIDFKANAGVGPNLFLTQVTGLVAQIGEANLSVLLTPAQKGEIRKVVVLKVRAHIQTLLENLLKKAEIDLQLVVNYYLKDNSQYRGARLRAITGEIDLSRLIVEELAKFLEIKNLDESAREKVEEVYNAICDNPAFVAIICDEKAHDAYAQFNAQYLKTFDPDDFFAQLDATSPSRMIGRMKKSQIQDFFCDVKINTVFQENEAARRWVFNRNIDEPPHTINHYPEAFQEGMSDKHPSVSDWRRVKSYKQITTGGRVRQAVHYFNRGAECSPLTSLESIALQQLSDAMQSIYENRKVDVATQALLTQWKAIYKSFTKLNQIISGEGVVDPGSFLATEAGGRIREQLISLSKAYTSQHIPKEVKAILKPIIDAYWLAFRTVVWTAIIVVEEKPDELKTRQLKEILECFPNDIEGYKDLERFLSPEQKEGGQAVNAKVVLKTLFLFKTKMEERMAALSAEGAQENYMRDQHRYVLEEFQHLFSERGLQILRLFPSARNYCLEAGKIEGKKNVFAEVVQNLKKRLDARADVEQNSTEQEIAKITPHNEKNGTLEFSPEDIRAIILFGNKEQRVNAGDIWFSKIREIASTKAENIEKSPWLYVVKDLASVASSDSEKEVGRSKKEAPKYIREFVKKLVSQEDGAVLDAASIIAKHFGLTRVEDEKKYEEVVVGIKKTNVINERLYDYVERGAELDAGDVDKLVADLFAAKDSAEKRTTFLEQNKAWLDSCRGVRVVNIEDSASSSDSQSASPAFLPRRTKAEKPKPVNKAQCELPSAANLERLRKLVNKKVEDFLKAELTSPPGAQELPTLHQLEVLFKLWRQFNPEKSMFSLSHKTSKAMCCIQQTLNVVSDWICSERAHTAEKIDDESRKIHYALLYVLSFSSDINKQNINARLKAMEFYYLQRAISWPFRQTRDVSEGAHQKHTNYTFLEKALFNFRNPSERRFLASQNRGGPAANHHFALQLVREFSPAEEMAARLLFAQDKKEGVNRIETMVSVANETERLIAPAKSGADAVVVDRLMNREQFIIAWLNSVMAKKAVLSLSVSDIEDAALWIKSLSVAFEKEDPVRVFSDEIKEAVRALVTRLTDLKELPEGDFELARALRDYSAHLLTVFEPDERKLQEEKITKMNTQLDLNHQFCVNMKKFLDEIFAEPSKVVEEFPDTKGITHILCSSSDKELLNDNTKYSFCEDGLSLLSNAIHSNISRVSAEMLKRNLENFGHEVRDLHRLIWLYPLFEALRPEKFAEILKLPDKQMEGLRKAHIIRGSTFRERKGASAIKEALLQQIEILVKAFPSSEGIYYLLPEEIETSRRQYTKEKLDELVNLAKKLSEGPRSPHSEISKAIISKAINKLWFEISKLDVDLFFDSYPKFRLVDDQQEFLGDRDTMKRDIISRSDLGVQRLTSKELAEQFGWVCSSLLDQKELKATLNDQYIAPLFRVLEDQSDFLDKFMDGSDEREESREDFIQFVKMHQFIVEFAQLDFAKKYNTPWKEVFIDKIDELLCGAITKLSLTVTYLNIQKQEKNKRIVSRTLQLIQGIGSHEQKALSWQYVMQNLQDLPQDDFCGLLRYLAKDGAVPYDGDPNALKGKPLYDYETLYASTCKIYLQNVLQNQKDKNPVETQAFVNALLYLYEHSQDGFYKLFNGYLTQDFDENTFGAAVKVRIKSVLPLAGQTHFFMPPLALTVFDKESFRNCDLNGGSEHLFGATIPMGFVRHFSKKGEYLILQSFLRLHPSSSDTAQAASKADRTAISDAITEGTLATLLQKQYVLWVLFGPKISEIGETTPEDLLANQLRDDVLPQEHDMRKRALNISTLKKALIALHSQSQGKWIVSVLTDAVYKAADKTWLWRKPTCKAHLKAVFKEAEDEARASREASTGVAQKRLGKRRPGTPSGAFEPIPSDFDFVRAVLERLKDEGASFESVLPEQKERERFLRGLISVGVCQEFSQAEPPAGRQSLDLFSEKYESVRAKIPKEAMLALVLHDELPCLDAYYAFHKAAGPARGKRAIDEFFARDDERSVLKNPAEYFQSNAAFIKNFLQPQQKEGAPYFLRFILWRKLFVYGMLFNENGDSLINAEDSSAEVKMRGEKIEQLKEVLNQLYYGLGEASWVDLVFEKLKKPAPGAGGAEQSEYSQLLFKAYRDMKKNALPMKTGRHYGVVVPGEPGKRPPVSPVGGGGK